MSEARTPVELSTDELSLLIDCLNVRLDHLSVRRSMGSELINRFGEAYNRLRAEAHYYTLDTDRCRCGGVVVYFEDGDRDGEVGEGCEVAGYVWRSER